jgi:perosamine synthetase
MELKIDWPARGHEYTDEEIRVVIDVMRASSSTLTQGERVKKFEQDFSLYLGVENCFATMSCAHALDLSAAIIDLKPGDEVIIPSHTYCASAISFAKRGAKIAWADIDPDSLTMSYESMMQSASKNTKAIVLVHLYGMISPATEQIAKYARERGIVLIEDCAQSLGASYLGKKCGTFGDIACFSFHAQKNMSTLGEGGMLYVKDPNLSKLIPGLRLNGHSQYTNKTEYWLPAMTNVDCDIPGVWPMKSTITECQAAVGSLLLSRLESLTDARRKRGLLFRKSMANYPELKFQKIYDESAHSHHLLPAYFESQTSTRDDLIRMLYFDYGIKAIVQYHPLHRYDLFKKMGLGSANVPNTNKFFDKMISFPFSITIDSKSFEYLIYSVQKSIEKLRER